MAHYLKTEINVRARGEGEENCHGYLHMSGIPTIRLGSDNPVLCSCLGVLVPVDGVSGRAKKRFNSAMASQVHSIVSSSLVGCIGEEKNYYYTLRNSVQLSADVNIGHCDD